jgi:hypothetical protein
MTKPVLFALLLLPAVTIADEKDPIRTAIDQGAQYLKQVHQPKANYNGGRNDVGTATLAGMALLESGTPVDDVSILLIAHYVREKSLSQNGTYQISLCIMFLDRLGNPGDHGLIQYLTLRLLSGQCVDGSWSYTCDGLNPDDATLRVLYKALVPQTRLTTPAAKNAPKPKEPEFKGPPKKRDDLDPEDFPKEKERKKDPLAKEKPKVTPKGAPNDYSSLHPELRRYGRITTMPGRGDSLIGRITGSGDHSNTQFATIGLWCGRRHGVDTSASMLLLEKHYRECQTPDGSWGYTGSNAGGGSPAMTCAGLMGMAMGFGARDANMRTKDGAAPPAKNDDIGADKIVEAGLKYLGGELGRAEMREERGRKKFQAFDLNTNHYLLWSVERVGMIYGLPTIGKIDWYAWGADALLATQSPDGSWKNGVYHGANDELNTSFALLFLCRANLAQDLSASLKGKVRDPGTARLIGGDLSKIIPGTNPPSNPPVDPPKVAPKIDPKMPVNTAPKTYPATPVPAANDFESKVNLLVKELLAVGPGEFNDLLKKYNQTRGGEYTEALARVAARMSGETQSMVRESLANRLTRMTAATLAEMMRDSNRELRRASALAAGTKGDRAISPELIRLIGDEEPPVVQSARASLKVLTAQDFGPEPDATPAQRTKALLAWKSWWDANRK